MEIQRYLFYFKIILFFSFSSFERNFVAMPLKVCYYPLLNISGPQNVKSSTEAYIFDLK